MNRPVKWKRILATLANGRPLTRFEAAELGDSVLPQTIHRIEQATGIKVEREAVTHSGWHGCETRCARYYLTPDQAVRARTFLGGDV